MEKNTKNVAEDNDSCIIISKNGHTIFVKTIKGGMAMPELKCGVVTCKHNKQNYCELDAIEVVGSSAKISEQTSCGSFVERKGEAYSNSVKEASPTSSVSCQAVECKYNNECRCHAGKINVVGSDANRVEQTECSTFKKEM